MIGLEAVLGWKFNHVPGISTKNGVLTNWPVSLGDMPTEAEVATYTAEFTRFETEKNLIAERVIKIAEDRERKEAVRQLKVEGKSFTYFDVDGRKITGETP